MRRHALAHTVAIPAALTVALALSACGSSTSHHHAAPLTENHASAAFAAAYVQFLDGHGSADGLPYSSASVRGRAATGGQLPAGDRRGSLQLVGVKTSGPDQIILSARNDKGILYAQETLTNTQRQGWRVTSLMTPDFEQAFAKGSSAAAPQPAGSAAAKQAARTFLAGFLPYYYGHGSAKAIRDATPALVKQLAAHPPNVPPTMTRLRGRVGAIGMQRIHTGWLALAEITDGQETYQLNLSLRSQHGRWLVVKETSS
jgi:hypothetical protein